jgi:RNA polymerase sigma factor (sigma-70 family)
VTWYTNEELDPEWAGTRKWLPQVDLAAVEDPVFQTTQLHGWLERMQAGDLAARDELLRQVGRQLERLARKMLRGFPNVHRWAQTDDVLQNSLVRLLRSLEQIRPTSTRQFFGLAAEQIRRELLDLARHFYGPEGHGANHASCAVGDDSTGSGFEPADQADSPEELEEWCAFHQEVEKLPAEEREVVGLIYYHGWTQARVAELLQITDRTVRRRFESALMQLHRRLKGEKGPD